MLAVRCAAAEFSFYSFVLSILLSGGVGGMTDARDSSLTASLFFVNSSYSSCALNFPIFAHSGILHLNYAPHPLLTYACCSGEKC